MLGSGCNFQRHCHRAIFVGIGYKFNDFFSPFTGSPLPADARKLSIDIIYADSEKPVLDVLLEKWERDKEQRAVMAEIIKKYGLVPMPCEPNSPAVLVSSGRDLRRAFPSAFTTILSKSADRSTRIPLA
jgi:hypothetical protein